MVCGGGLLNETCCIWVPRLHSCCWKGYRNDNWYLPSCKPESGNSQTTAWRPSKEEDGLMKSWQLRREDTVTVPHVRGVTVADMLATALLAVLSQVPQFNIGARDSVEVSLHFPWMRGSGFSLARVHDIHLGKWKVLILFLPFKNMVWRDYLLSFNWLTCSLSKKMLYFEAKRWYPTFGLNQLI